MHLRLVSVQVEAPIATVGDDDDVAVHTDRDTAGRVELRHAGALRAKVAHVLAVGREDLDAVIFVVCGEDVAIRSDGHVEWALKLARLVAGTADGAQEAACRHVEALQPVVLVVGHDQVSIGREGDARRVLELPFTFSRAAKLTQEAAGEIKDLDPAVLIVRHDDLVAFGRDHHACRLEELPIF